MDLADLLNAAQAGDRQAYDDLVRRQTRRLFRIARRVTGDEDLAEDAVQETFVRLLEGRSRLRRKAALDSWLARVATHAGVDLLRRRRTRRRREEAHALERPDSPGQEEALVKKEEAEILGKALDALPVDMRAAIWLHVVEGEGVRDVAECLGLTRSTVGRRIRLGLVKLRQALVRAGVVVPVGTALVSLLRQLPAEEPPPRLLARLGEIALPGSSGAAAGLLRGGSRAAHAAGPMAVLHRVLRPRTIALAGAGAAVLVGLVWVLGPFRGRDRPDREAAPVAVREAEEARTEGTAGEAPVAAEVAAVAEPRAVEIRGRAVDAASSPVPGADVVAYEDLAQEDVHEMLDRWGFVDIVLEVLGGAAPLARTRAGEDGTFTLAIQEPRNVVLHAFLSLDDAASSGMAHVLAAALGEEIEVTLEPATVLRGTIRDAAGAPLESALATVIPDPSMPFDRDFTSYDFQRFLDVFLPLSAQTDGGGAFAFPPLVLDARERHRILAVAPGRVAGHALVSREAAPIETRLLDAIQIQGRVVAGPGELPGEGARVIALGGSEGEAPGWFATAVADAEGRFIIGAPASARFRAWGKMPGYVRPGMTEVGEGADGPLVIRVGAGGAIRGKVGFARTGEPAAAVRVLARDLEGVLSSAQAVTDEAGRYRLEGLPLAHRYEILVVLPGYVPRDRLAAFPGEDSPEVEHDIHLVPTAVVRGKVVRPDGTGVPDATVEIVATVDTREEGMAVRWRREILEQGAITSGPEGEFADTDVLPAGKVYAWAYHPELGESFTGPLVFRGAEPRVAEAVVRLDGAGIEVRVTDTAGNPLAGITVDLTSSIVWKSMPDGMNLGQWYQQLTSLDISRQRRERSFFPGRRRNVTAEDGLSRWTDLMSDSYQLSIDRSLSRPDVSNFDQEYWLYMGTTESLEPLRVAVIDMPLDLGRRLSGTVVGPGGSGEEGLRIQVWFRAAFSGLKNAYGYSVTHTRAGGTFLAEGIGSGPYQVWVKREHGPTLKLDGVADGTPELEITYAPPEGKKKE